MNKSKYCFLVSFFLMLLVSNTAFAANKYVRDGATGANNGSDWTNAYTSLPAILVRGDTYYIADGSYPSYTVDDAVSGTLYITIRKATNSDHGTDIGWNVLYGDGQAIFNYGAQGSAITISTSYVDFDGVVGGGSDQSTYGFKLKFPLDCWGASPAVSLVAYTPSTGTATGTSTAISTTTVGPNLYSIVTDTGQSWTTNQFTRKFVGLTSGGTTKWYQITSNTSTAITTTCGQNVITDGFTSGATYQIRTLTGSNTTLMYAGITSGANFYNISIKHTSFDGSACGIAYRTMNNIGLKSTAHTGEYVYNLIIDHNYFGDTNTNIHGAQWEDAIVSNNYFASNYTGCGYEVHGQHISPAGNGVSIFGNTFKDSTIAAILVHGGTNSNGKIYNNIFVQSPAYASAASGLIQANYATPDNMHNWQVHHNTVIGATTTALGFLVVGNISSLDYKSIAYNNLFYNCSSPKMSNAGFTAGAIESRYNAHFNSSGVFDNSEGGTAQISTGNPFVNSANGDYRLQVNTTPGIVRGAPTNLRIVQ